MMEGLVGRTKDLSASICSFDGSSLPMGREKSTGR